MTHETLLSQALQGLQRDHVVCQCVNANFPPNTRDYETPGSQPAIELPIIQQLSHTNTAEQVLNQPSQVATMTAL